MIYPSFICTTDGKKISKQKFMKLIELINSPEAKAAEKYYRQIRLKHPGLTLRECIRLEGAYSK